jgi:hypothetical protein
MIFGLLYSLVRSLLDLLVVSGKTDATVRAEVLALRHQLRVLERKVHRPRRMPRHGELNRVSVAGAVLRHDRLGGLLHEYTREAA